MEDKDEKIIYLRNPRIRQQLLDIKNSCRLFEIDYFSANELNARLAFTIGFFLTAKSKNEEGKADEWFEKLMEVDKQERKGKEKRSLEEENVEKENVEKGKEALKRALEKIDEKIDIPEKEKPNILALVNLMWNNRDHKVYHLFPQFSCFEIQFANIFLNLDEVPTKAFYYNRLKQNANEEEPKHNNDTMFKPIFIFISYPIISKENILNNTSVILATPDSSDKDKLSPNVRLIFPSMLNYVVPGRSEDYEIYLKEEGTESQSHNESNTWAKSVEEKTKLFYKELLKIVKAVLEKLKLKEAFKGNVKKALSEIDSLIEFINMINVLTLYDANRETYEKFEKHKKELKEAKLVLENTIISNKNTKKKIKNHLDLACSECGYYIENVIDIRLSFIRTADMPKLGFLICKNCGEIIDNFTLNRLLDRHIKKYMKIIAKKWDKDSCMLCDNEESSLQHKIHKLCENCTDKSKNDKCPIPFCNKKVERKEKEGDKKQATTTLAHILRTSKGAAAEEEAEKKRDGGKEEEDPTQRPVESDKAEKNINRKTGIKDVKRKKSNDYNNRKLAEEFKCFKDHTMLRCGVKEKFTNCLECQDTEDYEGKMVYICRLCIQNKEDHKGDNKDDRCHNKVLKEMRDGKVMCKECLYILSVTNIKECYFCGAKIKDDKDYIKISDENQIKNKIKSHFIDID